MDIQKGKLIGQDSQKKIYAASDNRCIYTFKDETEEKSGKIKERGMINANLMTVLFKYLASYHIETHFIDVLKPGEVVVKDIEPLPVKIKIWNYASDVLCKRFSFEKWSELSCPIMELYLIDEAHKNPMVHFDHLCALNLMSADDLQFLDRIARKVNAVLKSFFSRRSFILGDCEMMFGRIEEQLVLGDAITLDSLTLLDLENTAKPDVSRFDLRKGDVAKKYELIHARIGG